MTYQPHQSEDLTMKTGHSTEAPAETVPAPEPCPRGADKLEETCVNRHQCWEPCGELGHDERFVRVYTSMEISAGAGLARFKILR